MIFTTSSMVAPAASTMVCMRAMICRAWAAQSPIPTILPSLAWDTWPDVNSNSSTCIPGAKAGLAVSLDPHWPIDGPSDVRILHVNAAKPVPPIHGVAAVELDLPMASEMDRHHLAPAVDAVREATDGQVPVGIVAPAFNARSVVDQTIELGVDFFVADAQWTQDTKPANSFPELLASPAIHVLADTVDRLRHHRCEETVQVIYRGGIRGGADAGKAICLGATAVSLGLSAVIGMGFKLSEIRDEQTAHDVVGCGSLCMPMYATASSST